MPTHPHYKVRVLVFHASLRRGSMNERLANLAAQAVERTGADVTRASIADFDAPSYNYDDETSTGIPAGPQSLCRYVTSTDGFIIVSPEYNASIPGALKNAIDWTSRFKPQPFNGKQGLLMSASPSMAGGNRGLWSARVPLEHLGARIYPDMFSLAQGNDAFADTGRLADALLQKRLEETVRCFVDLVEAAKNYPELKKQWVEFLGERPTAGLDRVETSTPNAA